MSSQRFSRSVRRVVRTTQAPRVRPNAFAAAIAAGLFVLPAVPVLGATITVGGSCTLVNSIIAANTDSTVGGACTAGSGADIIVLPANSTQTLSAVNNTTPFGATGLPVVTSQIVIQGNNSTIQRSGAAPNFRIFAVAEGGGELTLEKTTLSGGVTLEDGSGYGGGGGAIYAEDQTSVTLIDSTVSGNSAQYDGGGICAYGDLTLVRSNISGNIAGDDGGGIYFDKGNLSLSHSTVSGNTAIDGFGGGIGQDEDVGTTTISNSTISNNYAGDYGGGLQVYGYNGAVLIQDSTISGNTTDGEGGGLYVDGGSVLVINSTISGNSAGPQGGGIYVDDEGSLTITRSTISGNRAYEGGGVYCDEVCVVDMSHSTVSGNTAEFGGGIQNFGSTTLTHSTVTLNRAEHGSAYGKGGGIDNYDGDLTLLRCIVSGNIALDAYGGAAEVYHRGGGVINAAAFNVFSHSGLSSGQAFIGFTPGATDINASSDGSLPTALASILNTTLADNGGPTLTHALPAGSPAIDLSAAANCSGSTDQRGVNRPKDGNGSSTAECDSGAFERGFNFTDTAIEKSSDGPVLVGSNLSYTLSLTNSGPELTSAVEVADSLPAGLNFVSATPSQGTCVFESGTLSCELGNIAGGGGTASISLVAATTAVGQVTNTASFISDTIDSNANTDFDDDDVTDVLSPSVTLSIDPADIAEAGGVATVTATLNVAISDPVTVNLSFGGTALNTTDYTRSAASIVIPANTSSGSITLTAVQDALDEANETVVVDISSVTNASESGTQQVTATILDDDLPPSVRFIIGTNAVGEGVGAHSLTVQLSALSGLDVSVPFTVQGTANAADYSGLSASPLSIPAGSLSTTLNFNIVNDSLAEPDETLIFTLTAPTNATLGSPTKSLLTIKDNDAPPPDTTPNAFNFTDKKGVKPKTNITSNTITVGGLGSGVQAPIVLSNGTGGDASYSINGAAFRKTPATVKNGDNVRLRNKIPGNSGTATCTLSIGGVSDGWKITTSN